MPIGYQEQNKFKQVAIEFGYRLGNVGIHWHIYKYGRFNNSLYLMYWRNPEIKSVIRFADHQGKWGRIEKYEVRTDIPRSGIYNNRHCYHINDLKGLITKVIKETL